jgi:hypothetical protein
MDNSFEDMLLRERTNEISEANPAQQGVQELQPCSLPGKLSLS